MASFIPFSIPANISIAVTEQQLKDSAGVEFTKKITTRSDGSTTTEFLDSAGNLFVPAAGNFQTLSADIISAGNSPPIGGGNAQLVTIDVNSPPLEIQSTDAKGFGLTDSETLRSTEAEDSFLIQRISDGFQMSGISDSQNSLKRARVLEDFEQSGFGGINALMVAPTKTSFVERQENFTVATAFAGSAVGLKLVRVSRQDFITGLSNQIWYNRATNVVVSPVAIANVSLDVASSAEPNQTLSAASFAKITDGTDVAEVLQVNTNASPTDRALLVTVGANQRVMSNLMEVGGATFSLGQKPSAQSLPVVLASDTGDIKPNRTIVDHGFQQITNGSIAAEVRAVAPASTDPGLNVRQIPDSNGNTQTIGATIATAVNTKLSDGVDSISIIPGGISVVGASEPSLVIALSPNSADTFPNRTLANSGLQKITDGTSIAAVKSANTAPILSDPALVVSISGNSSNMAPLAPSVVATRHQIAGGQYLAVLPTLANLQQSPVLLDVNGAQVVAEKTPITLSAGVLNATPDSALGFNRRLAFLSVTNNTGSLIFAQIHDSAAALAAGVIPYLGFTWRIPGNSTVIFGADSFSERGLKLSPNARLAFSSVFGTYTAISMTNIAAHWEVI